MDKTKINGHFKTWISGLCSLALLPAGLMIATAANEDTSGETPPGGETVHNTSYGMITGGNFGSYEKIGAEFAHRLNPKEGAPDAPVFIIGEGTPESLARISLVGLCQIQGQPEDLQGIKNPFLADDKDKVCYGGWQTVQGTSSSNNKNANSVTLEQVDNKNLAFTSYKYNQDEDKRAGSVFFHIVNAAGDRAFYVVEVPLGDDFYGRLRLPSTRIYDFNKIQAPGAQMDYVIKRNQETGEETKLSWSDYQDQLPAKHLEVADPSTLAPDVTPSTQPAPAGGAEVAGANTTPVQVNPNPRPQAQPRGAQSVPGGGNDADGGNAAGGGQIDNTPRTYVSRSFEIPGDSNPAVGNGDSTSSSTLDLSGGAKSEDSKQTDKKIIWNHD